MNHNESREERMKRVYAEAVAYATDGDIIAIEPGSYKEGSLEISKKLCLIAGDGSGDIYHGIRLSQEEVEAPGWASSNRSILHRGHADNASAACYGCPHVQLML